MMDKESKIFNLFVKLMQSWIQYEHFSLVLCIDACLLQRIFGQTGLLTSYILGITIIDEFKFVGDRDWKLI